MPRRNTTASDAVDPIEYVATRDGTVRVMVCALPPPLPPSDAVIDSVSGIEPLAATFVTIALVGWNGVPSIVSANVCPLTVVPLAPAVVGASGLEQAAEAISHATISAPPIGVRFTCSVFRS